MGPPNRTFEGRPYVYPLRRATKTAGRARISRALPGARVLTRCRVHTDSFIGDRETDDRLGARRLGRRNELESGDQKAPDRGLHPRRSSMSMRSRRTPAIVALAYCRRDRRPPKMCFSPYRSAGATSISISTRNTTAQSLLLTFLRLNPRSWRSPSARSRPAHSTKKRLQPKAGRQSRLGMSSATPTSSSRRPFNSRWRNARSPTSRTFTVRIPAIMHPEATVAEIEAAVRGTESSGTK
jgi:hypothetical protein